ncbi:MAG: 3-hydroxyacyl-CoA dehydrogenase family protein [Hylemonella sp.]
MQAMQKVGVVGLGTMGTGIAIVSMRAGFETVAFDLDAKRLLALQQQSEAFFKRSVAKGKMTQDQLASTLGHLHVCSDLAELANCDIVIEAVFEDLSAKHALFSQLNTICKPSTLFASNTSSISITEIAGGSGRDDRFVGMHFCLPAQLMKLVEMSPGLCTSAESFESAWNFCLALGQNPVKTQDTPGFILNYFLIPFNNNAIRMVEAGIAEPEDIDIAMKTALGYAMGPMTLLDLVGMDTQLLLCQAMHGLTHEPDAACPPLVRRMIAAGRLGKKSGRGFFSYGDSKIFGA